MSDYSELVRRLEARQLLHVPTGLGFYSQADAWLDKEAVDAIEALIRERDALEAIVQAGLSDAVREGLNLHYRQGYREALEKAAETLKDRSNGKPWEVFHLITAIRTLIPKKDNK